MCPAEYVHTSISTCKYILNSLVADTVDTKVGKRKWSKSNRFEPPEMYLLALVGGTGVLYYSAQYAMPMPLPHQVQRLDHENTGSPQSAAHLTSGLVDGLGKTLDVAAGDAGY